jgi:hypothetical protein
MLAVQLHWADMLRLHLDPTVNVMEISLKSRRSGS